MGGRPGALKPRKLGYSYMQRRGDWGPRFVTNPRNLTDGRSQKYPFRVRRRVYWCTARFVVGGHRAYSNFMPDMLLMSHVAI